MPVFKEIMEPRTWLNPGHK